MNTPNTTIDKRMRMRGVPVGALFRYGSRVWRKTADREDGDVDAEGVWTTSRGGFHKPTPPVRINGGNLAEPVTPMVLAKIDEAERLAAEVPVPKADTAERVVADFDKLVKSLTPEQRVFLRVALRQRGAFGALRAALEALKDAQGIARAVRPGYVSDEDDEGLPHRVLRMFYSPAPAPRQP